MATARLECMYLNTSNPASKAWAAVRRHFTLVINSEVMGMEGRVIRPAFIAWEDMD